MDNGFIVETIVCFVHILLSMHMNGKYEIM